MHDDVTKLWQIKLHVYNIYPSSIMGQKDTDNLGNNKDQTSTQGKKILTTNWINFNIKKPHFTHIKLQKII